MKNVGGRGQGAAEAGSAHASTPSTICSQRGGALSVDGREGQVAVTIEGTRFANCSAVSASTFAVRSLAAQ